MADLRIDPASGDVDWVGVPPVADSTIAPAPESAWERLYVALTFGLENPILAPIGEETLRTLRDPWTMITFAGILAAWALAQFTPLALGADAVVAALGWAALGGQIVAVSRNLARYAEAAYRARTEGELRTAGTYLAAAIVEAGKDGIELILSYGAFRAARATVETLKVGGRFAALRRPQSPKVTEPGKAPAERPRGQRPGEGPAERPVGERAPEERPVEERAPEERPVEERAPEERPLEERLREERLRQEPTGRARERFGAGRSGALGASEQLGGAAHQVVDDAALLLLLLGGTAAAALIVALLLSRRGKR